MICPTCKEYRCGKHCNHCGNDIVWRHPLLDAEIKVKNPRALNPNGAIHFCMKDGTKDGNFYYTGQRYMVNLYRYGYPVVEFPKVNWGGVVY